MKTISIQVDSDVAKAFEAAQPQQKQAVQSMVNDWLKKAIAIAQMQAAMDKASDEAKANGLTPEILQSILDE